MIDLSKLINLLPRYFKQNDTYKDSEGAGILERFLSVCGNYFKNEIMLPIDNITSILEFDKPVEEDNKDKYLFINLVWEFLGSIPYGYGAIYDGNQVNNPWKENADLLPRAKYWDILKYAVSLYKIRGTIPFYTILMSFYDIDCEVLDPTDDTNTYYSYFKSKDNLYFKSKDGKRIRGIGIGDNVELITYDSNIRYDDEDSRYDGNNNNCLSCNKVILRLNLSKLPKVDEDVKCRILLLLNRFRPINVVEFNNQTVIFIDE